MFQRRDLIRFQSAFNDHLTYFLLKSSVVVLFFSCILVIPAPSLALFQTLEYNEWSPYGVHLDMLTSV